MAVAVTSAGSVQNAPSRPAAAPAASGGGGASGPSETFESGQASALRAQDIQSSFEDRRQREATVESMFVEGTGSPNAEQRERMMNELGVVDNDVLRLAADSGLQLAVADPGDDLQELGVITPLTAEGLQQKLPAMKEGGQQLVAATDQLGQALSARNGYQGDDPARIAELDAGVQSAIGNSRDVMMAQHENETGATLFSGPVAQASTMEPGPMQNMAMQQAMMAPNTVPLEMLAVTRGAQTPEEIAEFTGLVKEMNGDRLGEMNERGLASLRAQAADGSDPYKQAQAQQMLERADGHTMVNWNEEAIAIPDLNYYRPEGAETSVRLDDHDLNTAQAWGGTDLKADPFIGEDPNGTTTGGQHIHKTNRLVLQNGSENAAVHEVGHAVEEVVSERDPDFYQGWSQRVNEAFEQRRADGNAVTAYSLEDVGEYTAEGFSHYYEDPKLLQARDPALYALTEEMITRARGLANQ